MNKNEHGTDASEGEAGEEHVKIIQIQWLERRKYETEEHKM